MPSPTPGDHFGTSKCGGQGASPFPMRQFPPLPPHLVRSSLMASRPPHLCSQQPKQLPGPPGLPPSRTLHPSHPAFFEEDPVLPFLEQTSLSSLGPSSKVTLYPAACRHPWTPQAFIYASEAYLEKHMVLFMLLDMVCSGPPHLPGPISMLMSGQTLLSFAQGQRADIL